MLASLLVLCATCAAADAAAAGGSAGAPFNFSFFPHFQWRARVMHPHGPVGAVDPEVAQSRGGEPAAAPRGHPPPPPPNADPGATTFTLFDSHHARPLGGPSTFVVANATGEWSPPASFSNTTVSAALAVYPNTLLIDSPFGTAYDERAGQANYPAMVVFVQVSGAGYDCDNRTHVQLEVSFGAEEAAAAAAPPPPLTLDAVVTGCTGRGPARYCNGGCAILGLMVGRNVTTAQPMVATFREYNARQYWAVLDRLDLAPLAHPPKLFPLMDNLAGDDDVGMWTEGIDALAKLGFHGLVVPKPNLTRPLLQQAMGNQLTTGPGRFLLALAVKVILTPPCIFH
jgi:hypothetical protein